MLTPFKDVFEIPANTVGLMSNAVTGDPNLKGPGSSYKVYLPVLMADIKKGSATEKTLGKPSSAIFINNSACKPQITSTLHSKNYVTVVMAASNSWDHHCRKMVKDYVTIEYLKQYDKVDVNIPNGKLSKGMFNTTTYTKEY